MFARRLSATDRALVEVERAIGTAFGAAPESTRPTPAADIAEGELSDAQRQHAAGLMRINHAGEVCAQALYSGQAAVARDAAVRTRLLEGRLRKPTTWPGAASDSLHYIAGRACSIRCGTPAVSRSARRRQS